MSGLAILVSAVWQVCFWGEEHPMSRKELATAIACAVFTGAACASGVSAAEVYELNPVLVTAQRSVTKDMETPAAIEVLHADDLQKTGATSVQEALKFSTGIITHGQGPRNISQGTMTSKAVIRGVEKGTLVLVDGVPINQGGRYNLEDIPVESIDRVEVVRGGGAVLYGSEANGGVINIITKGKRANMVKAGFGNYGIQNYAASFQAGKLGFTATYDHTGKIDHISAPTETTSKRSGAPRGLYYNIKRGEHANFNARYDFNYDLYVTHTYGRNSDHYVYKYTGIDNPDNAGKEYKNVIHSTEENLTALHYTKNNFSVNAFYNRRDQETENASAKINKKFPQNFDSSSISHDKTSYLDQTVGINFQNRWNFHKGSFMLGYEFQRDMQDKTINKGTSVTGNFYSRNAHSLFGQVAYDFTQATQANLNFRQTWTEADDAGNKYDKFTPEFVLMHHLDESTMVYGKVGQSFMLPTFTQLYGGGNIVGVPDLKPEKGMHYELGAKKSIGKNAYRVALYSYKIEDFIDADTKDWPEVSYKNSDVKNTGIEIDWTRNQNENLSYRLGLTYSHPQKQEGKIDKHGVETKGEWHDYYGKLGFNAGIDYTRGKLTTAFHISYLGDRTRDASPYASMKAQLFSDINFSYQANDNARFFLNIDNLFNRHDIISTSTSSFYNLGRNFMAGVEYKF